MYFSTVRLRWYRSVFLPGVSKSVKNGRSYDKQESPAIADKPARRESMPKIAGIRRAYNVVADNTGLSSCV